MLWCGMSMKIPYLWLLLTSNSKCVAVNRVTKNLMTVSACFVKLDFTVHFWCHPIRQRDRVETESVFWANQDTAEDRKTAVEALPINVFADEVISALHFAVSKVNVQTPWSAIKNCFLSYTFWSLSGPFRGDMYQKYLKELHRKYGCPRCDRAYFRY